MKFWMMVLFLVVTLLSWAREGYSQVVVTNGTVAFDIDAASYAANVTSVQFDAVSPGNPSFSVSLGKPAAVGNAQGIGHVGPVTVPGFLAFLATNKDKAYTATITTIGPTGRKGVSAPSSPFVVPTPDPPVATAVTVQ